MNDDNQTPATKGDIKRLDGNFKRLETKMDQWKEEIIRHFDVVAEQLRHEVLGANRDEVGVIKDKQTNHEERIERLEQHTGVVAV